MATNKIIGLVLLVVGGGVLFWAYTSTSSVGSQVGQAINGSMSFQELAGYVVGVVLIVAGVTRLK